MATTATALSDQQLEAELRRLKNEAAEIQKKLDGESSKLAGARGEHQRLVAKIASGAAESDVLHRVKGEVETLEIRIGGYNGQLAENRSKTDELGKELGRRQVAAAKAAHEKEFAELLRKGEEAAQKILAMLTRLVTEDVPAFDAIRRKLGVDFGHLGGEVAALRLREMLWKAPGPRDAIHDPNVHLRLLFDRGWVFADAPGPSRESFRSVDGGFQSVPGGELSLQIISMRPKK